MRAVVRNAKESDIPWIAARLRPADRDEVDAGFGRPPADAMLIGMKTSCICKTIELGGAPAAIFGVFGEIGGPGNIWLLGTTEIVNFKKTFVEILNDHIARFLCAFPVLFNYVDARNEDALKWIRKAGAVISDPEPYGVKGMPFRRFEIRRDEPCASPRPQFTQ